MMSPVNFVNYVNLFRLLLENLFCGRENVSAWHKNIFSGHPPVKFTKFTKFTRGKAGICALLYGYMKHISIFFMTRSQGSEGKRSDLNEYFEHLLTYKGLCPVYVMYMRNLCVNFVNYGFLEVHT